MQLKEERSALISNKYYTIKIHSDYIVCVSFAQK